MPSDLPLTPLETPYLAPRGNEPARVTLGTMNFGKRTSAADAARIMDRALERGVALFDTANVYNDGESERIVGRAGRVETTTLSAVRTWIRDFLDL